MITGYEIKNINGEERLFIYLDLTFEFASFKKTYKKSFKEILKDFFKTNKIYFHGKIISIVVGGLLIGNLVLNRSMESNDYKSKIIDINSLMYYPSLKIEEPIVEEIKDEIVVKEPKQEIKKVEKKESNNQNKVTENIKEDKAIESKEKIVDNNIYINIKKSNGEMFKLELEEYIVGVVSAEMPALFHEEALKSQAIISRTYALKAISNGKILTDNESTQSYKSISELKSLWGNNFDNYYNKIKNCVNSTKGMYLTYNGNYIEAVFHSTSNGKTESSLEVWGNFYPYLISVESKYDYLNPSFEKNINISYEELSNKLGYSVNNESSFNTLKLTEGGRVKSIQIVDKIYSGVELRKLLNLRSTDFVIEKYSDYVKIITKGYGHGVGLSQYGANGMAKNGYNYEAILKHYYKGVVINKSN